MRSTFERPDRALVAGRSFLGDVGMTGWSNGLIGFIFAASGPLAIILSVGSKGGISAAELSSWVFGVFVVNGLITMAMSRAYRTPLCFFWTIPGTVLVGPALQHMRFTDVIGAFYATGALILFLGASGWVGRVMRVVPMPLVMGMVAGIFLRFGIDLVRALHDDLPIAGPMACTFLVLSAWPALGRRIPPMIGALLVGATAVLLLGHAASIPADGIRLAWPLIQMPTWSLMAMVELVVPLAITVLVVQNGQGVAVLQTAGHRVPINGTTVICGIGSLIAAGAGAISTCLTGPTSALITQSGERSRHYAAAIVTGMLSVAFGLLAPTFTGVMLAMPRSFIVTLAGLAMLRVLQAAFTTAFRDRFSLGALVSFLVTVADTGLLNIGAAFWGLLAGVAVSWLLERSDFTALVSQR